MVVLEVVAVSGTVVDVVMVGAVVVVVVSSPPKRPQDPATRVSASIRANRLLRLTDMPLPGLEPP